LVEVKSVVYTLKFEREFKKVKDSRVKEQLKKQIEKIIENPDVGKPLRYDFKGERTVYVKPCRLIYKLDGETLYLLRFEHRKEVYG
jgi:mRNA-degrading endonuclease RelE of RelBE toxin-antitoxin system